MLAVGKMTSPSAEQLAVRCCTDFRDLEALAEDWNKLVDHAEYPNVFLRWEWVGTWWKYFGDGRSLRVYLVYDGSRLVGILPLYARRRALCGISRRMVLAPIGFGGRSRNAGSLRGHSVATAPTCTAWFNKGHLP